MIIKNFNKLATSTQKGHVLSIIEAGLQAAMPDQILRKIVNKDRILIDKKNLYIQKYRRVFVVAVGKAADSMTRAVNSLTRIDGGVVVVPNYYPPVHLPKKFKILMASHPIPDRTSVYAAKTIIEFLENLEPSDFIIFLVSGGGSSLVTLPEGISLRDKQRTTDILLKSGANIQEINCVIY